MIGHPSQNEPTWVARPTLVLLPLLLLLSACDWRGPQTLPGQMVGEWRTDEPRYHGRFVRLESDRITFGLGGLAPDSVEHVERVSASPSDNPTDYTIRLKAGDGTPDSIALQFTLLNGGELRLKSQPKIVWKRKSEPARMPPTETPQPGASRHESPSREPLLPPARTYGEHMTIYKIDCVKPKSCRSY
jgi:hypothetical protein